jgi:group I intron endonuclease
MNNRASGIYEIVNTLNGKRYVGSAVDFRLRWNGHRMHLRRGSHHSRHLQVSWAKHGEAAFEFRVIRECERADLIAVEQAAIDSLKPEYNCCPKAGSTAGYKHTPAAIEKLRAVNAGRRLSDEHRAAITAGKLGKDRPDMIGNKWGCRRQTEAERLVNSLSKKGLKRSPESRARLRAASSTPEMRAHRSNFMKAVWAARKAALANPRGCHE